MAHSPAGPGFKDRSTLNGSRSIRTKRWGERLKRCFCTEVLSLCILMQYAGSGRRKCRICFKLQKDVIACCCAFCFQHFADAARVLFDSPIRTEMEWSTKASKEEATHCVLGFWHNGRALDSRMSRENVRPEGLTCVYSRIVKHARAVIRH